MQSSDQTEGSDPNSLPNKSGTGLGRRKRVQSACQRCKRQKLKVGFVSCSLDLSRRKGRANSFKLSATITAHVPSVRDQGLSAYHSLETTGQQGMPFPEGSLDLMTNRSNSLI